MDNRAWLVWAVAIAIVAAGLSIQATGWSFLFLGAFVALGIVAGYLKWYALTDEQWVRYEWSVYDAGTLILYFGEFYWIFPGFYSWTFLFSKNTFLAVNAGIVLYWLAGTLAQKAAKRSHRFEMTTKVFILAPIGITFVNMMFAPTPYGRILDLPLQCEDVYDNDHDGKTDDVDPDCAAGKFFEDSSLEGKRGWRVFLANLDLQGAQAAEPDGTAGTSAASATPRRGTLTDTGVSYYFEKGEFQYVGFCEEGASIVLELADAGGVGPYRYELRFGDTYTKMDLTPGATNFHRCVATGSVRIRQLRGHSTVVISAGAPEGPSTEELGDAVLGESLVAPSDEEIVAKAVEHLRTEGTGVTLRGVPSAKECTWKERGRITRGVCVDSFRDTGVVVKPGEDIRLRVTEAVPVAIMIDGVKVGKVEGGSWETKDGGLEYCIAGGKLPAGKLSVANMGTRPVDVTVL